MVMGGGFQSVDVDAVASTAIVDLKQPNPSFQPGPAMDAAKMYVSAVVLPDSTVFETGGGTKSIEFDGQPVLSAQIFHPKTNTWTKTASPTVGRLYHSSAVLLPDGRVATFGSNPKTSFEMRIEVFTPPYLQTGTRRPTVTGGATEFHYGDYGTFTTTQASSLTSVVLVRPEATTHSSDPNQRLIDVGFTKTSTGISVTMPTEPNLAPPGWYMLYAVDANGVPSVAKWVHLEGAAAKPHGGYVLDGYGGIHPFALTGASAAPRYERPVLEGLGHRPRRRSPRRPRVATCSTATAGCTRSRAGVPLPPATSARRTGWAGTSPAASPSCPTARRLRARRLRRSAPVPDRQGAMPPAVSGNPMWVGQDRARGITLLADGTGGYVVDSTGKLYPFRIGSGKPAVPPVATPYAPGASGPAVRGAAIQPNRAAGFVLDAFGALHTFPIAGGVPLGVTGAPSWPGMPIARGIAI